MAQPKVIILKGIPITKEGYADGAVMPGQLLEKSGLETFEPHGTAGGNAAPRFALPGSDWGNDIDTPYADGDTLKYGVFRQGDEVYAFLNAGASATAGDYLESAGNGSLRPFSTGVAFAQALETIDNSGGASNVRLRVEVI